MRTSNKSTNDGSRRTPHGTIGNAIRHLRKERGWSQRDLAKRLGIAQPVLARCETGVRYPSVKVAKALAIELNVPLEFLMAHRLSLFG